MKIGTQYGYFQEDDGNAGSTGGNEGGANEEGSLLDGAGESGDANQPENNASETGDGAEWFLREGVKGEGDAPEWFQASKYKTVEDQAKAYPELAKKFGAFTGAPEEYEISVPEDMADVYQYIADDPLLKGFQELARESNMDQATFTKLLHLYAQQDLAKVNAVREQEVAALGKNASSRIRDLTDWSKANLTPDQFDVMRELTTTARGVELIETLISKGKHSNIVPGDGGQPVTTKSRDELQGMVNDPRYKSDPVYRKEVEAEFKRAFGDQPYHEIRN